MSHNFSNDIINTNRLSEVHYGPQYDHIAGKNNIIGADDDEKLSETEDGLVLSHLICAVKKDEATSMPDTEE
jgi:hypothetical protein